MIETRVYRILFILTLLATVNQIQPSLHVHNNAFVQDDNDVQYLLDSLPISMHKDFSNSVYGTGDSMLEENIQDSLSYIEFEPNILNFKERQLGVPHQETVTLFNRDDNRTIYLSSISGNTQHFHSSFFQDKVIPPLGNTTFSVVFLGRSEGEIDSYLFIHTSEGNIKYQVKGVSISSPYRLRPVVGVKLPINASFTPLIYMHNPHSESMQIVEVYSSGREFQLELPSGEMEGPRELWEIPPFQTKPVIRLHFNAYTEKNHTAYIRFKVNNSAEILIVAVEIEVISGAGLHWGGSSGVVNFGMGGSNQSPIRYQIALKNSAKKPVKVQNIISIPTTKALKIDFEPITIPGDTDIPMAVGTLIYDWKAGLNMKHFKGKLIIKGTGPSGSSQKLTIPWIAEVLQGGLEVNASAAHYCSPHSSQPRNFSVINKFKLPLAITNVSLSLEAMSLFSISNFVPKILKPGQRDEIFTLSLAPNINNDDLQFESSILIHSNVSTTEVPLFSYNGKLRKIIPGERKSDKGSMNFGTVSSGTENEGTFALENQNPVSIELQGWGVNMPGAVLELMGCQSGPTDLFNKGVRNITACSVTGNQSLKRGYLAIFKIKVKTPHVEEDTIVGDVFVKTPYERLTVPVYMRVAHGKIHVKKIILTDCFPGSICMQHVKIHSTFVRPMEVTFIKPVHKDERVKYAPLSETSYPIISKGDNHIGSIVIDPSVTCKQLCYLGLSLNNSVGNQWLNTLSLPLHTRDSDLNLLNTLYTRYLNITNNSSWDNVTLQLDTSEVRSYKFTVSVKPHWPSLLVSSNNAKNKSLLSFPLTQVGNTSYKNITLHNPSLNLLLVHLVMDWNYPQGSRLFQSLPNKFKPSCPECSNTILGEFKLEDHVGDKNTFERGWGISCAQNSIPFVLEPNQTRTISLSYTPKFPASSSALLYIRNNMTILEILRLLGRGAHAQFKFGNRKPGSTKPLLFELTEKHLQDCDTKFDDTKLKGESTKSDEGKSGAPRREFNLMLKRSFMARNTGELVIDVHKFYINGLTCEGYGFKVLNCEPFTLQPNDSRKIEIAFTPDFTLSRVERDLLIETSMGWEASQKNSDEDESMDKLDREINGIVRLGLLSTLPANKLEACARILARPSWEQLLQCIAIILAGILFIGVLVTAILEADRILNGLLLSMSRGNPTQPPLDLRLLSLSSSAQQQHGIHISNHHQHHGHNGKEKMVHGSDDNNSKVNNSKTANKKEDLSLSSSLVWSFVNGKRGKEKAGSYKQHQPLADWSAEEESRFRMDNDLRDGTKRCIDSVPLGLETHLVGGGSKKRGSKHQQRLNSHDASPIDSVIDVAVAEMQLVSTEKKSSNKSSPTSNRKQNKACKEETAKLVDCEVQMDISSNGVSSAKSETTCKRKQSTNNSSNNSSNHNILKKYEANTSQKVTQYSEEETSSTTTESSVQEDSNTYKDCENNGEKSDKSQRKSGTTKSKSQVNSGVPSLLDYKDNYEDDGDDDDYNKDGKQVNPNSWKTTTARSNVKSQTSSRSGVEATTKLVTRQKQQQQQNPPKKEKSAQKRRSAEKSQLKVSTTATISAMTTTISTTSTTSGAAATATVSASVVTSTAMTNCGSTVLREEPTRAPVIVPPVTSSPSLLLQTSPVPQQLQPAPLPAVCWGENRAKFSDVVARNQDISSPTANYCSNNINAMSYKPSKSSGVSSISGLFNFLDGADGVKHQPAQEIASSEHEIGMRNTIENELISNGNLPALGIQSKSRLNSYFVNSFCEPTYEPDLVPYNDLPDTDEPLTELENLEENSQSKFWQSNNSLLNSRTNSSIFPVGSRKSAEKVADNWVTMENNWEPLYSRGAVGEERSGVWGINTGGVWAAAPWGAPPPPSTLQNSTMSQVYEPSSQGNSGFDPFRSLSTIWTPSSTDIWTTKKNNEHVKDTH